jgi:hypothetical protein
MKHQWGRSTDAGRTRSRAPIYTLLLLPLAFIAGVVMAVYQYGELTTLQRWYFTSYVNSTVVPRISVLPAQRRTAGRYQLVDEAGDHYAARHPETIEHAEMEKELRKTVYGGRTLAQFMWDFAFWPVATAIGVLLIGLFASIPLDRQRVQSLREGQTLRGGPQLRTVAEFNGAHRKNDGLRIRVEQ